MSGGSRREAASNQPVTTRCQHEPAQFRPAPAPASGRHCVAGTHACCRRPSRPARDATPPPRHAAQWLSTAAGWPARDRSMGNSGPARPPFQPQPAGHRPQADLSAGCVHSVRCRCRCRHRIACAWRHTVGPTAAVSVCRSRQSPAAVFAASPSFRPLSARVLQPMSAAICGCGGRTLKRRSLGTV